MSYPINQSPTPVPLTAASLLLSCSQLLVIALSTQARRSSLGFRPSSHKVSQKLLVLVIPLPDSAVRELLLDLVVLAADRHPVLGVVTPLRPQCQPRVVLALTLDRSLAKSVDLLCVPDKALGAPPRCVDRGSDETVAEWSKWELALVLQKEHLSREANLVADEGLLKLMQVGSTMQHRSCVEHVAVPPTVGNLCRVRYDVWEWLRDVVGCCSWEDGRELWRSRRCHGATEIGTVDCTEVLEHLGSLFWRLCERDMWQEWAVFVLESLIVTSELIISRGRVVMLAEEALVLAVLVLLLLGLIVQRVDIGSVCRALDRLAVAPRRVEDWVVVHCGCGCSRDVKR
jgi:hypothetical protein